MSNRALYMLGALAALLVGGVIAQVIIETLQRQPNDVNPVLAAMAGSAVTALFSGHFFSSQAATLSDMRDSFGSAISTVGTLGAAVAASVATPTPSASSGSASGSTSTGSPMTSTTLSTPPPVEPAP